METERLRPPPSLPPPANGSDEKEEEETGPRVLRELHQVDLLSSLEYTLYSLFVLSYLSSPSHFISLCVRLVTQLQFSSPANTSRPLRSFITAWGVINMLTLVIHITQGSRGTKGRSWHGQGLFLDLIGQADTPSTFILLLLDVFILSIQFIFIVVSFARRAVVAAQTNVVDDPEEMEHEYSALLGEPDDEEDDEVERTKSFDPLNRPIVTIRLREVWKEVVRRKQTEVEAIRDMEEGRSTRNRTAVI